MENNLHNTDQLLIRLTGVLSRAVTLASQRPQQLVNAAAKMISPPHIFSETCPSPCQRIENSAAGAPL